MSNNISRRLLKYLPFADMTSICMYPLRSFSTLFTVGTTFSGAPVRIAFSNEIEVHVLQLEFMFIGYVLIC